jgi:large subunit ribosomal protein L13
MTKTFTKAASARKWYVIDLQGKVLGRAASQIARVLRGKNKSTFTPHEDTGDFVVAINAKGLKLTGNKLRDKIYHHHSGYIGGIKDRSAAALLARKPEELVFRAVKGMLPKTHLGKKQIKKLKIYAGADHPHSAQRPEALTS